MSIRFEALPTEHVRALQRGGRDANDQLPERKISDGGGIPCRHCLCLLPKGRPYLVLACRPFATIQPYAELGPIFLCAEECANGSTVDELPPFLASERYIVRGYDTNERIVYGTGQVTPTGEIIDYCRRLFDSEAIAFVHVRSATNNCFHVRVERNRPPVQ
jgi:hypothetical protein